MDKGLLNAENIINQNILHQVEALCTAEEPAACTAACPLHVDARELCHRIAKKDWSGAFKGYQKTVPFARILAHACTAPCMQTCKREELGGAIQIQKLEQTMAEVAGKPGKAPIILPKKKQKAAVVGGGMRGLSAAHDLARKGYQVTLFEKTKALGGKALDFSEEVLPKDLLEAEFKILKGLKIKVEFEREIPISSLEEASELLKDFDGVFISCASPLDSLTDETTQQVSGQEMLLAGKNSTGLRLDDSIVYQMFDGRSAAATLDRLFQKVNLQAGRDKAGSYSTTLYTSMKGIEDEPQISITDEEGAIAEASRCIQCRCEECVKKCGFLQHYGGNPSKYVREVYNNLSIAMGTHHANGMINTCALCSQCEAICPNGLDMQQVFRAARQRMVESKKMPASAFEFGLLDLEYSMAEKFFLARHQKGYTTSSAVFFPGCQLAASEPGLVKTVYADLCDNISGGVGLMLSCCGILAHWAGDEAAFTRAKEQVVSAWEKLGKPKVIAGCPTCGDTLRNHFQIETESLFETLNGEHYQPVHSSEHQELYLHHACGARYDNKTKQSVISLVEKNGGHINGDEDLYEQSPCCGYGGLVPVVDAAIADEITDTGLEQLGGKENSVPVLTYCANCRDRFLAKGRQSFHLLEILYPQTADMRHLPPKWSTRQDNRTDLKYNMLAEIWGEKVEREVRMKLYMDEALEQKFEETHILHRDIEDVIAYAEDTNEKLLDPVTGHFTAYHRPRNVTFWVEYSPEEEGFRVHNAYSHRMDFILTDKITEGREKQDD